MRRTRPLFLPTLFLALLAPASLGAQEVEADSSRQNCVCFDREPGTLTSTFVRGSRARIGVYLGDATTVDGSAGVEIVRLEEEGPAEAAGLRGGDIITAVDGTGLGEDPGAGLVDAIGELEPGDAVDVTYYRDGDRRTAEIVTDESTSSFSWLGPREFELRSGGMFGFGDRLENPEGMVVASPRGMLWRFGARGLDLVDLNPGLAEYFGTDQGVLVVDVDQESLALEPGDVILSIDGREIRDATHVRSILASYRDDEAITFEVVRHERTREVTGTVR